MHLGSVKILVMPRDTASRRQPPRPLHAGDLFTDRVPESEAFRDALSAHRHYIDSTEDIPAAKNVMVFYGVGGIGKTALSKRLQQWVTGELPPTDLWGPPPLTSVAATSRIDLHRSQGRIDLLSALITIRRAFGTVRKKWPGFDLAFAAYWSSVRPGEELPGSGSDDTVVADGVTDTLKDALSDLGIPGVRLATQGLRGLVREICDWQTRRGANALYPGFDDVMKRCAELPTPDDPHPELLAEIASLLDSDLCNWPNGQAPLVVAFVDTFERLTADPRRVDEATLNALVWSLPNVLFVMSGRNLVDWFDESRTNLPNVGRMVWPGLVPGVVEEPRQHLVGMLADLDRIRVVSRGREIYGIPISDDVVNELARASGGLPQYLDLALSLALNRLRNDGSPITVADVTGSLSDLVLRVLEDVPDDEQRALRAAALFPFFDNRIVAAAAGVDDGCAKRAMSRPMIDTGGSGQYPHTMHDAIRSAIRNAGHDIPNGWSEADWRQAGERGLAALRHRYVEATAAQANADALETLGLAIALVCRQRLAIEPATSPTYEDWITQAIVFGPSIAGLRTRIPTTAATDFGKGVIDFVVAKTTEVTLDEAVELLTSVFESEHPLRLPAGRHRGYTLRNGSRWEEAIAAFDELVALDPTVLHRYQRVFTLTTARRFREALDKSHALPEDRQQSIRRSCAEAHGRFEGWFEAQNESAAMLREKGRAREALEKEGTTLRWRAFIHGDVPLSALKELQQEAQDVAHLTALRDAYLGQLFTAPQLLVRDLETLSWFENIDRARNFGEIGYRTALARIAIALCREDNTALGEIASAINTRGQGRGRHWVSSECLLDSYGYGVDCPPTQWREPYHAVRNRWRGHFERWLAGVRSTPSPP